MIRAVLDSNVLISSLFWKGLPRHIVDLAIARYIEAMTSPDILLEIEAVLREDFSDIPLYRYRRQGSIGLKGIWSPTG